MNKKRNALRAGIFIILSIALAVTVIIGIKGLDRLLDPVDKRDAALRFRMTWAACAWGDDVRIGGFKVGQIREIEVVPPGDPRLAKSPSMNLSTAPIDQPQILVTFAVPKKYEIKEGATRWNSGNRDGCFVVEF